MRAVKKIFNKILSHEKLKGHTPETSNREIPRDEMSGLFKCQTTDRAATSKYKYSIIKHLKSCRKVNKNKKGANKKNLQFLQ